MEIGTKVMATKMAQDSFYRQVFGTVEYVRNGYVGIRATMVMSKWDNKLKPPPTSCLTAAKLADVVTL
jgi:hypothetical protein